jgi:hypothetical protein
MEVSEMKKRTFIQPTAEEIEKRKKMYQDADELGIDLLSFDGEDEAAEKRDIRKAIILLTSGKVIPNDLRERLLTRKKRLSVLGNAN